METPEQATASKQKYGLCHADLEEIGEREVRSRLNSGKYGLSNDIVFVYVSAWLNDIAFVRSEAREEESLSISREALRNSERAIIWAAIATLIAAIAIIVE